MIDFRRNSRYRGAMNLYKHTGWSISLLRELEESLTTADRDALRADLDMLGAESWAAWIAAQKQEIERYACATPAMRAKRKKWREPALRRRLTLAAMYIHDKARHALARLDDFPFEGVASYRNMSLYAAWLFDDMREIEVPLWPFDEDGNCTYS